MLNSTSKFKTIQIPKELDFQVQKHIKQDSHKLKPKREVKGRSEKIYTVQTPEQNSKLGKAQVILTPIYIYIYI